MGASEKPLLERFWTKSRLKTERLGLIPVPLAQGGGDTFGMMVDWTIISSSGGIFTEYQLQPDPQATMKLHFGLGGCTCSRSDRPSCFSLYCGMESNMDDPLYCTWIFGAPCLKPEVWAAWWQAFLAGLAIWWAARIASSTARRELSRRVDVYVHLIEMAANLAGSAVSSATAPDDASKILKNINLEELDQVTKSLRAISLHDAPDYRLLPLILQTARICEELEGSIKAVFDSSSNDFATSFYNAKLKIDKAELSLLSVQAKVIGAEYKESIFPRLGAKLLRKKLDMKGNS